MFQSDFMLKCWTLWLFSLLVWFLFADWRLFWHVIRIYILCARRLSIANAFFLWQTQKKSQILRRLTKRGRGNKTHESFRIKWKCDGFDVSTIFSSTFLPFICHAKHIWTNKRLKCAYIRLFTFISNQLNLLRLIHLWKSRIIFLIPSTDAINNSLFWPACGTKSSWFSLLVFGTFFFLFVFRLFFTLRFIHFSRLMVVMRIEFNMPKQSLP